MQRKPWVVEDRPGLHFHLQSAGVNSEEESMNTMNLINRGLWKGLWVKREFLAMLAVTLIIGWFPGPGRADSSRITPADIKLGYPFEITAGIMQIDYAKNRLIMAEQEVYAVDLVVGAETVKTAVFDAEGGPIAFDELEIGQTLRVRGIKLPDGRLIAGDVVCVRRP
jgi:hypothetical protein